jgi:Rrf2 family protein
MLSNTCKAAIRSVVFLASRFGDNTKLAIKEIAENIDASEHTTAKLLQTLVKQKLINSAKGPSGGFYLDKEQLLKPIIQIVYAIDGPGIFKECGLGLNRCSEKHPCPLHFQYKESREKIEKLFKQKNVKDLSSPINVGRAFLFS